MCHDIGVVSGVEVIVFHLKLHFLFTSRICPSKFYIIIHCTVGDSMFYLCWIFIWLNMILGKVSLCHLISWQKLMKMVSDLLSSWRRCTRCAFLTIPVFMFIMWIIWCYDRCIHFLCRCFQEGLILRKRSWKRIWGTLSKPQGHPFYLLVVSFYPTCCAKGLALVVG